MRTIVRTRSSRLMRSPERENIKKLTEVYAKRRPVLKAITNFWPVALFNHQMLPTFIQHNADQTALSYLEDIWVTRDPVEHRFYSVEFVGDSLLPLSCRLKCVAALQREPVLLGQRSHKDLQVCPSPSSGQRQGR